MKCELSTHGRAVIDAVLKIEPCYAEPARRREFWRRIDGTGEDDQPQGCVSIDEAARRLGSISRKTIARYVAAGRLDGVYTATGKRRLRGVTAQSLDALISGKGEKCA